MRNSTGRLKAAAGLALPGVLLVGLLGVIAGQLGLHDLLPVTAGVNPPELVTLEPRTISFRPSGEFQLGRASIDAPLRQAGMTSPLDVMKYQVSAADYLRCVEADACKRADPRRRGHGNVPVTGVSYNDAVAYAAWLSAETGTTWRLPTVAEWTMIAGEKASDPALGEADVDDPATRWLAFYEREAALGAGALATPEVLGTFGVNQFGVADLAGPVWEWTATCDSRTRLEADGSILTHLESCGAHVLEGRHRATMTNFVRDAVAGGCSSGTPPDNLGFRLVRERGVLLRLVDKIAHMIRI